jgi:colicin import membrane protein
MPATAAPRPQKSAIALSIALHLLVLTLLIVLPSIHMPEPHEPQSIQAVLVSPHHARPIPEPAVPVPPAPAPAPEPVAKSKPVPPPAPKPLPVQKQVTPLPTVDTKKAVAKAEPKPAPKPTPKPAPKPLPTPPPVAPAKPVEKPEARPEPKPVVKPPVKAPEKKPVIQQSDIDAEMADIDKQTTQAKQQLRQAQMDQMQREAAANVQALSQKANKEIIRLYQTRIRAQIRNNWIRPLSAKNGMMSVLRITLQPGGEVMNVVTLQHSGDAAFDASAEAAVWKASPLPVPDDPDVFNGNFRTLRLEFKPEDL